MARNSKLLQKRNEKINQRFESLVNNGVSRAIIFQVIEDEFFIRPSQLYKILEGNPAFFELKEYSWG
jgi:hypothetical protein